MSLFKKIYFGHILLFVSSLILEIDHKSLNQSIHKKNTYLEYVKKIHMVPFKKYDLSVQVFLSHCRKFDSCERCTKKLQ